jgi:hypothetical protein
MDTDNRTIELNGVESSKSENLALEMGRDLRKQSLPLLNDVFSKMIVLNTALIGTFLGLKDLPLADAYRPFVVVLLLLSLVACFYGLFPKTASFSLDCPRGIGRSIDEMLVNKSWTMRLAAACLVSGLALGAFGLMVSAYGGVQPPPAVQPTGK